MALDGLLTAARTAAPPRAWSAGVELARSGSVIGLSDDGDEVHCHVKARGRAKPFDVYLWPGEPDWGCDCGLPGRCCLHVAAAVIAVNKGLNTNGELPKPGKKFKVSVGYEFTAKGTVLTVSRNLHWPDGRVTPLTKPLAQSDVLADRADIQAEAILAMHPGGKVNADSLRRIIAQLAGSKHATLDGKAIKISREPLPFRVRVSDHEEGFKVQLVRPSNLDTLYRGAALTGKVLQMTSHGSLSAQQRKTLVQAVYFTADEVGGLVAETIPRLRERIPVDIATDRLPKAAQCVPRVAITLEDQPTGLKVTAQVVYGDPVIAKLEAGVLKRLADVVPARDIGKERQLTRKAEDMLGVPIGVARVLPPAEAADFLRERFPKHNGPVYGKADIERYRVTHKPLIPHLNVQQEDHGFGVDVRFETEDGEADVDEVLRAWVTGRSLVPLMDGGWAPLPVDWLAQHGPILRELLEARDNTGVVGRQGTAALVELLEETKMEVPTDLQRLRQWLEGDEGLPDVELSPDFVGELREYQNTGVRWLRFLRNVDLHGILADDMGLGKTVQAIVALLDTPGDHLVVAPTSVIRNWEREAARFAPSLTVNVYHGPNRVMDDSRLTLTSYALLRLDKELLSEREWAYIVLDEAQAIKNPDSQTARAACSVPSQYRLALSGTPVENRLDELWSLFRFLMPGYLGSRASFRDRFSKPIEAGEQSAAVALRRRVKPYVLRRLKKQVAKELPELTEVVIRCEMSEEQRKVYEAMRIAGYSDVQRMLSTGEKGRTFDILEALLRMRQAACDPALLPGDHAAAGSGKLDRLEELLVDVVTNGHKLLVFSQWTSLLNRVEERLKSLNIEWTRLDGTTRNRQGVVDHFQSDDGPPVFLLSLKAGGTGLNLTAADYVVILDPWWNPAVEQQAMDRAHRIGQEKPVVACRFIAENTVEERILELQEAKRALADAALGTDAGFLNALSGDELRKLFEPA